MKGMEGGSCAAERRRESCGSFCGKLLSVAAILCCSQLCLTWNFRAENCTTVFVFEA